MPDFSQYPESLAERKASNTPGGAHLWTLRDALIAALRDIDSGKTNPSYLIISIANVNDNGETSTDCYQSIPSTFYGVGLLTAVIRDYLNG